MYAILCVADKNGMMFNNHRQSQDKVLYDRIIESCGTSKYGSVHIQEFCFILKNCVSSNYLEMCKDNEYAFIEDTDILFIAHRISKLLLYKWNRVYPADVYMTEDLSKWTVLKTYDFTTSSHVKITEVTL